MTSSVRAKRAADQKAANRKEEEMRLAKVEGRIADFEEKLNEEAYVQEVAEPVTESPAPAPKKKAAAKKAPAKKKAPEKAPAKKK